MTFSQAATFPVAGLTALHALAKGGLLLGKRVLVTGATGGVGDFAVQLARLAGAHVTASVRREDQIAAIGLGAHEVIVGDEIPPVAEVRPRVDSVGGRTLGTALAALQRSGVCVTLGVSASAEVTFDAREFFVTGPHHPLRPLPLHGVLQRAGVDRPAASRRAGGGRPARAPRQPRAPVDGDRPGRPDLMARRFPGKAVLIVD